MSFDGELVGKFAEFLRKGDQQFAPSPLSLALPLSKNVPLADSESSMRRPSAVTVISMWLLSFSKSVICRMACCSCSFSLGMLSSGESKVFSRALHVGANLLRGAGRIFEISANCLLHLLAAVEQPEHDEQCHHGGDKVGIGDFPRAAMMAAVAAFFLEDDDGAGFVHSDVGLNAQAAAAAAAASHLHRGTPASSSLKEGRT